MDGLLIGDQAPQSRYKIVKAMEKGQLLQYYGRTMLTNCIIISFRTSHDSSIRNGMSFSLTLKQIHVATKKRVKRTSKSKSKSQQTSAAKNQKVHKETAQLQAKGNGGKKEVTHPYKPFPHLVRRGQTWESIAEYYDYKPYQLREWNKQYAPLQEWDNKYKQPEEGIVLNIGEPEPVEKKQGPHPSFVGVLTHEVKKGENWQTVAAMYGMSAIVLKARNQHVSSLRALEPGMILGIA